MDERNRARRAAGMIPVTQTTSQILDTALDVTAPWSIATDTTPLIRSRYQHPSHPYLSDLPARHMSTWPEFVSRTQTSPRWRLKLPDSSMKTTKIPSKYRRQRSSRPTSDLPKRWVYVEDDEEGKREELRDPNRYGHLPPRLIHAQRHLAQQYQLSPPRDSPTT